MHLNNLLLSVALPAAAKAIDVVSGAAQNLGQSFTSFLAEADAPSKNVSSQVTSVDDDLAVHADGLRAYLSKNGVSQGFRIRFEKSSTGQVSGGVTGENAGEVASLIQQQPHWFSDLGRIASAAQAANSGPTSGFPPHLNIEITERGTSHWFFR